MKTLWIVTDHCFQDLELPEVDIYTSAEECWNDLNGLYENEMDESDEWPTIEEMKEENVVGWQFEVGDRTIRIERKEIKL